MLLAVPNVSTGPHRARLAELERVYRAQALLLDTHSDATHQRSVFTIAGPPADLAASLLTGAATAIDLIDMNIHEGAHPRIGALDVCPVVYLDPDDRAAAEALARKLGAELAALGLPVFFYGDLASDPERCERHYFRRGGIEALAERMASGELRADLGPDAPHSSAGAVLVTARPPLAAFNVEVEGISMVRGREIAAMLRESGGGLYGVRAIAIDLGADRVQISTNVHDPRITPLAEVVSNVHRLAFPVGGRAVAAELVGLVPEAALADYPDAVPIRSFNRRTRTIEGRLRELA